MTRLEHLDQMRKALGQCTFPPATAQKRFARQVAAMYLDKITEKQWRYVIRLAWRYRRQMPPDLVPSKDAIEALDGAWAPQEVAGMTVMTTGPRAPQKPPQKAATAAAPAPLPLFEVPT
jgi:hypothetical protein